MHESKQVGAKRAIKLPLSVPVHSRLMKPASEALAKAFEDVQWQHVQIPIVQNVNAKPCSDVATLQKNLLKQVYQPVLWHQSVSNFEHIHGIIECGPGRVLYGLNRRIRNDVEHVTLANARDVQSLIQ